MPNAQNARGRHFEQQVEKKLRALADKHRGLVELRTQPPLALHDGRKVRPDFELVYRTDAEHHLIIECQSRSRTSTAIIDKIRTMRELSRHNRFVFVFEDARRLGKEHRRILETMDGVPCLDLLGLEEWLKEIDGSVTARVARGGGGGGGMGGRLVVQSDRIKDPWHIF